MSRRVVWTRVDLFPCCFPVTGDMHELLSSLPLTNLALPCASLRLCMSEMQVKKDNNVERRLGRNSVRNIFPGCLAPYRNGPSVRGFGRFRHSYSVHGSLMHYRRFMAFSQVSSHPPVLFSSCYLILFAHLLLNSTQEHSLQSRCSSFL